MKTLIFLISIISILSIIATILLIGQPNTNNIEILQNNPDKDYGEKKIFKYQDSRGYEVNLYSRVVIPNKALYKAEKPPVALIISGQGPTDLNCNDSNTYLYIAQQLEIQGIASVRYNKRALYPSYTIPKQTESEYLFDDLAEDAAEIIKQLQKSDQFSSYFILGHSEGSSLGMLAITKYLNKYDVQGFVSLAGPGLSAVEIFESQLEPQLPQEVFLEVKDFMKLLQQGQIPNCFALMEQYNICDPQYGFFRSSVLPYLVSWFQFNPQKVFSTMTYLENFIVQGSADIQVSVENAESLQKANETNANNMIFNGMDHLLKKVPEDRQQDMSYIDPSQPLYSELSEQLGQFILNIAQNY